MKIFWITFNMNHERTIACNSLMTMDDVNNIANNIFFWQKCILKLTNRMICMPKCAFSGRAAQYMYRTNCHQEADL